MKKFISSKSYFNVNTLFFKRRFKQESKNLDIIVSCMIVSMLIESHMIHSLILHCMLEQLKN